MSNINSNDELVSQFMAFTGSSDTDRAASYLEMSGGNLETAVGLFMEHQGSTGVGPSFAPGDSAGAPSDAAAGFGLGAGAAAASGDGIRAPDATQTMRLMDDEGHHPMFGPGLGHPYMRIDPILQEQLATSAFARDVVNTAAAAAEALDESMEDGKENDDDDEENNDGSSSSNNKKKGGVAGLADMFAPPHHLMYKDGGFEGARTVAKDSKRWLLVNLQRDAEFSCHALNRDVWRDELVENLIREGFIFWQEMDITPEGAKYAERYKVYDYPHIAIIDPRTRRLMWKKEGWTQQNPLTSVQFAESAVDFCSRHSFDKPPQAPRPHSAAGSRPSKRPMHEMSEEEQLQAAMRASLQESGADLEGDGNEDDYEMVEDDDEVQFVGTNKMGAEGDSKPHAKEPKDETTATQAASTSMIEQLLSLNLGDEPTKGARIQFRMPDGKRKIRKFEPSQNVRLIYAFVAQSMPEVKDGKEFSLMAGFPPKDLLADVDNTIESCSLAGEAITVRWK